MTPEEKIIADKELVITILCDTLGEQTGKHDEFRAQVSSYISGLAAAFNQFSNSNFQHIKSSQNLELWVRELEALVRK